MPCLRPFYIAVSVLLTTLLVACQGDEQAPSAESVQQRLVRQLNDAQPGDHLELPSGHFQFDQAIKLNIEGLTLTGADQGETVLSFGQQATDEASVQLLADGISLHNLSIEDSRDTGVLIQGARLAQLKDVRVQWQQADAAAIGVQVSDSRRLLLAEVAIQGAAEAGIRIQRSTDVVVRDSRISDSLIGIDIRNSQRSDLYGNTLVDNTQGLRIVNALTSSMSTYAIRLFDNDILRNNRENTALEGSELVDLWRGIGVQIEGGDAIEVFNNRLADNDTADIYVRAVSADAATVRQSLLDRYPESIYLHDNQYGEGGSQPEGFKLKWLRWTLFGLGGRLPPVLWDGQLDPAKQLKGQTPIHLRLCVPQDEALVLNLDQANDFADPQVEPLWHQCRLPSLPGVSINW